MRLNCWQRFVAKFCPGVKELNQAITNQIQRYIANWFLAAATIDIWVRSLVSYHAS